MHQISIATHKDTEELSKLVKLLMAQEADFRPNEAAQKKGLELIVNSPDKGIILKLESDNKLVGMINILFTISTAMGDKVAIFEDFVVVPDLRNKGYGKMLFDAAEKVAKEHGCKRVTLLTDRENIKSRRFYKKQGMAVSAMVPFRKYL